MITQSKTPIAENCAIFPDDIKIFWESFSKFSIKGSGTTSHPSLQPGIQKYFEKLLTMIASSPKFNPVVALQLYVIPW